MSELGITAKAGSAPEAEETKGNIRVVCRFRPLNEREKATNLGTSIEFPDDNRQVHVNSTTEAGNGPLKFAFDAVFPPTASQASVYDFSARPIIDSVLEGFNGTVLAYGQTGSGKTFTMTGADVDDERLKGIIPRMINTVFETIATSNEHLEFAVKVGYCEIYMEKIKDLLNPVKGNLKVHEEKSRGVFIADLTEEYVSSEEEVANLMKIGQANREVGFTLMNEGSSRSHAIFIMTVTQNSTIDYSAKTGKLYLVDLAGSEKVGKTGAEGKRLDEAKTINKSLSTLGKVINSLTDGKSTHIPYRDSKLTRVLQDSLGGNSKTALIITASPSIFNEAETISTLRFGIRAKAIKNKPVVNKEYTVAELKLLLAKAEMECARKDQRIEQLETALMDVGVKPPVMATPTEDEEVMSGSAVNPPPELQELHQQLEDASARLAVHIEELTVANQKLVESDNRILDLLSQRDRMQSDFHRLLDTIHTLEEANQDLETRLQHQACEFQSQLDSLTQLNSQLEGQIVAQDQEIASLNQSLRSRRSAMPRGSILIINDQLSVKDMELREVKHRLERVEEVLRQTAVLTTQAEIKDLLREFTQGGEYIGVKQLLELEKNRNLSLTDEISRTKARLEAVLQDKSREDLIDRIRIESELAIQRKTEEITSEFQEKINQMKQEKEKLLEELEMEQINSKNLEESKEEEERMLRKKVLNLETELQQVTANYQKAVSEKKVIKLEELSIEKKLHTKDTKIEELRQELVSLKTLKPSSLLETPPESDRVQRILSRTGLAGTRIKKTIKGGKAQKLRVMGMFSPLTSLSRNEDSP